MGLGCLGALLFTAQDTAVKWFSADYTIAQIVFLRSILALAIALVWTLRTPGAFRVQRPLVFSFLVVANIAALYCFHSGLARLPLTTAISIFFLTPIGISLLAIPILKEKPSKLQAAALLAGFAGVLVITQPFAAHQPLSLSAVGLVLLSVLLWSLVATTTRALTHSVSISAMLFYSTAGSLVFFACLQPLVWRQPPVDDFVWLLLIGILAAAAQLTIWSAYRSGRAAFVAVSEYSALIFAAWLGWLIWDEQLTAKDLIGIALIVGAGVVSVFAQQKANAIKNG